MHKIYHFERTNQLKYKLGLKPVQEQPRFMLANYLRPSDLPSVESLPTTFGHADVIKPQMFLNDRLGCCAISGSIEEIRLLNAACGVTVPFSDKSAQANYTAVTGYNPADPDSDQGTDVHELFEFRKAFGLIDDAGNRHKVAAYVGLTPRDFDELLIALRLFQVVGIGIEVPDYAEAQFEAGQPWHPLRGYHRIEGGHYIPGVSRDAVDQVGVFTWGAKTGMTKDFYRKFNTVSVIAITEEMFTGGKTIDGFDHQLLLHDLTEFHTGPVMSKAPWRPEDAA